MREVREARLMLEGSDAALYVSRARAELGILKQLMGFRGLAQLTRTIPLAYGGEIAVSSVNGFDTIRITTISSQAPKKFETVKPSLAVIGNDADRNAFFWTQAAGKVLLPVVVPDAADLDSGHWAVVVGMSTDATVIAGNVFYWAGPDPDDEKLYTRAVIWRQSAASVASKTPQFTAELIDLADWGIDTDSYTGTQVGVTAVSGNGMRIVFQAIFSVEHSGIDGSDGTRSYVVDVQPNAELRAAPSAMPTIPTLNEYAEDRGAVYGAAMNSDGSVAVGYVRKWATLDGTEPAIRYSPPKSNDYPLFPSYLESPTPPAWDSTPAEFWPYPWLNFNPWNTGLYVEGYADNPLFYAAWSLVDGDYVSPVQFAGTPLEFGPFVWTSWVTEWRDFFNPAIIFPQRPDGQPTFGWWLDADQQVLTGTKISGYDDLHVFRGGGLAYTTAEISYIEAHGLDGLTFETESFNYVDRQAYFEVGPQFEHRGFFYRTGDSSFAATHAPNSPVSGAVLFKAVTPDGRLACGTQGGGVPDYSRARLANWPSATPVQTIESQKAVVFSSDGVVSVIAEPDAEVTAFSADFIDSAGSTFILGGQTVTGHQASFRYPLADRRVMLQGVSSDYAQVLGTTSDLSTLVGVDANLVPCLWTSGGVTKNADGETIAAPPKDMSGAWGAGATPVAVANIRSKTKVTS